MTKNGNTTIWRLTQLEKGMEDVIGKVEKIMTNHIPHLHEEMQSLKVRVNLGIGINVILYVSAVIGIIMFIKG